MAAIKDYRKAIIQFQTLELGDFFNESSYVILVDDNYQVVQQLDEKTRVWIDELTMVVQRYLKEFVPNYDTFDYYTMASYIMAVVHEHWNIKMQIEEKMVCRAVLKKLLKR